MKRKKTLRITLLIIVLPLLAWGISYAKCEINTLCHGKEFEGEYRQTNMIGGDPKPKVLNYSDKKARVYYADEFGGDIISFEYANGKWIMYEWNTVWAKGGSADGFVWPYIR